MCEVPVATRQTGGGASSPPLLSPGWPTMWPRGRGRCQAGHCDRDFGPTENGAAVLGPLLPLASSSKRDPPRVLRHTQKVRPRAVARESVHFESHANPHRFVAAPRPRVSCTARPRRRAAPAVATSARAAPWSSSAQEATPTAAVLRGRAENQRQPSGNGIPRHSGQTIIGAQSTNVGAARYSAASAATAPGALSVALSLAGPGPGWKAPKFGHTHTRAHTCTHARTHVRAHTHTHPHTHTHTHTHTRTHTCGVWETPQTPTPTHTANRIVV